MSFVLEASEMTVEGMYASRNRVAPWHEYESFSMFPAEVLNVIDETCIFERR